MNTTNILTNEIHAISKSSYFLANIFKIDTSTSNSVNKVNVLGGGIQHIAALKGMQLSNPERNWEMFSNWAESVRTFPDVTKQTVRETEISTLNYKTMLDSDTWIFVE